jgi:hypothetical protein
VKRREAGTSSQAFAAAHILLDVAERRDWHRGEVVSAMLVPLTEIEPVPRFVTHAKDWRGFDRSRLVRLLKGFVAGDEIEPVPLCRLPVLEFPSSPYQYRVVNCLHRFCGSIAAGFVHLPASI